MTRPVVCGSSLAQGMERVRNRCVGFGGEGPWRYTDHLPHPLRGPPLPFPVHSPLLGLSLDLPFSAVKGFPLGHVSHPPWKPLTALPPALPCWAGASPVCLLSSRAALTLVAIRAGGSEQGPHGGNEGGPER